MSLYAESSAVLAWLLGEQAGERTRRCLEEADAVVASDLTLVECDRVLIRAVTLGHLREADASGRRAALQAAAARWHVLHLGAEIVSRARQPFPGEPIRTLDALHLACALAARSAIPALDILTLDERIRATARALGLTVLPG
jgi:predicted nucleic acid-binding protein